MAGSAAASLRFAVWAPNAQSVKVVFGKPASGYIANDGAGIDAARPLVDLSRSTDGVWRGGPQGSFETFKSLPYMYRIVNAQGQTVYRSDIFSRSQIGKGAINPAKAAWPGTVDTLDGTVSCSVVIDPDVVRRGFESTSPGSEPISSRRRNSGPMNSRSVCRFPPASKTSSSTSYTSAHWDLAKPAPAI